MQAQADKLALRRRELVAQCADQRVQLRGGIRALGAALTPAALAVGLATQVRARPALLLAAVAVAIASRRGGVRRYASHAIVAWRVWQAFRGLAASLVSR